MNKKSNNKKVSKEDREILFSKLKRRLDKNNKLSFHWPDIKVRLEEKGEKLWSLNEMERTGGEPNLFEYDTLKNEFVFYDFSKESPAGRRSLCYDDEAHQSRKENKPKGSALNGAHEMGVQLLTEQEYYALQEKGDFDTKTSSWVQATDTIRKLGGALFCDKRFNRTFTYHNGAESYYAGRGFRGSLRI
ncbi:MAG: DUF4256 domain-containing protein [Chitinophagaceae bacterium]